MCAVAVFCFFNWVALNAQSATMPDNLIGQLVMALAEQDEPELSVQDWMTDFEIGFMAEAAEPEMKVEPWMLSFNHDYMAKTGDSLIPFEPWMINFEQRCLVVDTEQDQPVECWMVSTCTWDSGNSLLAVK
jgi:hypothetical protein